MGHIFCKSEDENSRRKQQGSREQFSDPGGLRNVARDGSAASTYQGHKGEKYKIKGNRHDAGYQRRGNHDQPSLQDSKHKTQHKNKRTKKKQKSQNIQTTSEPQPPVVDQPRREILTRKNEELDGARLSSKAAARMTHDNPNIPDLSDQNRPTKIAERFSELYDNQWTDAFDNLQKKHDQSETDAIEFLLDVLYISFNVCKDVRERRERLLKALKEFIGDDGDNEDETILEVMRTVKGTKRNIKKMQEQFKQRVEEKLAKKANYKAKIQDIKSYMDECVELCLLMNIQEPPVELKGLVLSHGDPFDLSSFRHYTESGNLIKYIVWPALYLYQNGPLLCKGVAQGMPYSLTVKTSMSAKHDANSKIIATQVSEQQSDHKAESIIDQVSNEETVNIELEVHKKKLKASPTLTGSHNESSPHQAQRNTKKSSNQYDKPVSSEITHTAPMGAVSQSTETSPNHSATTGQQQRVDKPEKMCKTVIDVK